MASTSTTQVAGMDIAPLTWVQTEIEASLNHGLEAAFSLKEKPDDQTAAGRATNQYRQAVGALQMINLEPLSVFGLEIEALLAKLLELPPDRREPFFSALDVSTRKFALYLTELTRGAPLPPLLLFPEYEAMQKLCGAKVVFPADLFFPDLSIKLPDDGPQVAVTSEEFPTLLLTKRRTFQHGLLDWLRGNTATGADRMLRAVLGIVEATPQHSIRTFWTTVAALFDIIRAGALKNSFPLQHLLARVDLQIRRLAEGGASVAERLRRETLYFIALIDRPISPRVAETQKAFNLSALIPQKTAAGVDVLQEFSTVREMKSHVNAVKAMWARVIAGQTDQFAKMREELLYLFKQSANSPYPEMQMLFGALGKGCEHLNVDNIPEAVGMEFATALLFAEDIFAQYGNPIADLTQQIGLIRQRIDAALAGQKLPAFNLPRLSEISQQAEDKSLLPQLASGIQANLRHMEQELDAFFRDHTKREALESLAKDGHEISGALRVLGRNDADELLSMCLEQIDSYTKADTPLTDDDFELLAESLSAMGFYIEALQQNRSNATLIEPLIKRYRKRNGLPDGEPPTGGQKIHVPEDNANAAPAAMGESDAEATLEAPAQNNNNDSATAAFSADAEPGASFGLTEKPSSSSAILGTSAEKEIELVAPDLPDFSDDNETDNGFDDAASPAPMTEITLSALDEEKWGENWHETALPERDETPSELAAFDANEEARAPSAAKSVEDLALDALAGMGEIKPMQLYPAFGRESGESGQDEASVSEPDFQDENIVEEDDRMSSTASMQPVEVTIRGEVAELMSLGEQFRADPSNEDLFVTISKKIQLLGDDAKLINDAALLNKINTIKAMLAQDQRGMLADLLSQLVAKPKIEAPSEETKRLLTIDAKDLDAELLDIFLEEAADVLDSVEENRAILANNPNDIETIRAIRRAFHTLKGSGRMVGLSELGELAYDVEKIHNQLLEGNYPASPNVQRMMEVAEHEFRKWIQAIVETKQVTPDPTELHVAIDVVAQELEPKASLAELLAGKSPAVPAPLPASENKVSPAVPFEIPDIADIGQGGDTLSESESSAEEGNASAEVDFPELTQFESPDISLEIPVGDGVQGEAENDFELPDDRFSDSGIQVSIPLNASAAEGESELPASEAMNRAGLEGEAAQAQMYGSREAGLPAPTPFASAYAAVPIAPSNITSDIEMPALVSPEKPSPARRSVVDEAKGVAFLEVVKNQPRQPESVNPDSFSGDDFSMTLPLSAGREASPQTPSGAASFEMPSESSASSAPRPAVFEFDVPLDATAVKRDEPEMPLGKEDLESGAFFYEIVSSAPASEAGSVIHVNVEDDAYVAPVAMAAPVAPVPSREFVDGTPTWAAEQVVEKPPVPQKTVDFENIGAKLMGGEQSAASGAEVPENSEPLAAPSVKHDSVHIGDIVLPKSLYDTFTVEAAQHWQTLSFELSLMRLDENRVPSEEMIRAAHTLGSIHGTTGFTTVLNVGRALEHLLIAAVERSKAGAPSVSRLLPVAARAIAGLRVLMDRILIKEPFAPAEEREAREIVEEIDALQKGEMVQFEPVEPVDAPIPGVEALESDATSENEGELTDEQVRQIVSRQSQKAKEDAQATSSPAGDAGDGIHDSIDKDLLPIFLDESRDLMSAASENLAIWEKNPEDGDASLKLKRALHTLKGSARMVGAMRLGELAHKMESDFLECAHPTDEDRRRLETSLDQIGYVIAQLRDGNLDVAFPWEAKETLAEEEHAPVASESPSTQEASKTDGAAGNEETEEEESDSDAIVPIHDMAEQLAKLKAQADIARQAAAAKRAAVPVDEGALLRVSARRVDELVNESGEIIISRTRAEGELRELKSDLLELTNSVIRLRQYLRTVEIEAESRIQAQLEKMQEVQGDFDPLEFDRFTHLQETTRSLAESVNDVSTIQQTMLTHMDSINAALLAQSRMSRDVQGTLFSIRTVPFNSVSDRLFRIMRQLTQELQKNAELEIKGGQNEIDRAILERLIVPLEHLLRNSLDHGVEPPEVRVKEGKPEHAAITIDVAHISGEILIKFSDDGRGINREKLRDKVRARGEDPDQYDDAALINVIFDAGFSTAEKVTAISGRGIGLDIVRNDILSMGGRVDVSSEEGKGTTFLLYLPLTVSVIQAMLVKTANGRSWALPASMVEQIEHVSEEDLAKMYQDGRTEWQGRKYPFFNFDALVDQHFTENESYRYNAVAFIRAGKEVVAVHVAQVSGNQEIVIKSAGTQLLRRVNGLVGATILGTGEIVLIVNPVQLARRRAAQEASRRAREKALALQAAAEAPVSVEALEEKEASKTVLVVDDSLTVRKVTSRFLTREGFNVETAKDGFDALKQLSEHHPDIILLDIEMPKMDGFEFAKLVKGDDATKSIPIIMITSRTADKHRQRARELGVNGYLGKPYQEDELLGHIKELIDNPKAVML